MSHVLYEGIDLALKLTETKDGVALEVHAVKAENYSKDALMRAKRVLNYIIKGYKDLVDIIITHCSSDDEKTKKFIKQFGGKYLMEVQGRTVYSFE